MESNLCIPVNVKVDQDEYLDYDKLVMDENGLIIDLISERKRYSIRFKEFREYKYVDLDLAENRFFSIPKEFGHPLTWENEWFRYRFFEIKNSERIKQLVEDSCNVAEYKNLRHYLIRLDDAYIDIISVCTEDLSVVVQKLK